MHDCCTTTILCLCAWCCRDEVGEADILDNDVAETVFMSNERKSLRTVSRSLTTLKSLDECKQLWTAVHCGLEKLSHLYPVIQSTVVSHGPLYYSVSQPDLGVP